MSGKGSNGARLGANSKSLKVSCDAGSGSNTKTPHYRQNELALGHGHHTWLSFSELKWHCDFEKSICKGIESSDFGKGVIEGCYFHFCSNLWKNVVNKGLRDLFCDKNKIYMFFGKNPGPRF